MQATTKARKAESSSMSHSVAVRCTRHCLMLDLHPHCMMWCSCLGASYRWRWSCLLRRTDGGCYALCLPGGGSPVLADCRACIVMVRSLHGSPEVRFLDFDWAGRAGEVRYPSFMNHQDDLWPPDVQESAPALQRHDRSLLKRHLPVRPQSVMCKQPSIAWQPKHHLRRFVSLCTVARVCPCGRLG